MYFFVRALFCWDFLGQNLAAFIWDACESLFGDFGGWRAEPFPSRPFRKKVVAWTHCRAAKMMWKPISGLAEIIRCSNIYLYSHTHTHICRDMYLKYDMCFILSIYFYIWLCISLLCTMCLRIYPTLYMNICFDPDMIYIYWYIHNIEVLCDIYLCRDTYLKYYRF